MLKKIWDIWWLKFTLVPKLISAAVLLVILLLPFLWLRGCSKPPVIDEEKINKINSANEKERKAELQKVIEENQEVIETVDNRTTIAETNVIERNRVIDEKVKEADKAIAEAKKRGRDVTAEELECLLTGNLCP